MKSKHSYLFILVFTLILQVKASAQEVDSLIIDTTASIEHQIALSTSRSTFRQSEDVISSLSLSWSVKFSDTWTFSNAASLLRGAGEQSLNLAHTINYNFKQGGLNLTFRHSNNPIAPNYSVQLSTYKWMSDKYIINSQLTRINFKDVSVIWAFKISNTFLIGRYGVSLGLTQDMSSLSDLEPLINLGLTHETPSSDVISLYCVAGAINQPQFNFQLVENTANQLSFGGWARKKINPRLSITGGWGYTQIKNNSQIQIQSNQFNISLSVKL